MKLCPQIYLNDIRKRFLGVFLVNICDMIASNYKTQTTEGTGNSDHPQGLKEKNHPSSGENK